ncbi:hypothetical protein BY996DRAFT_6413937 [Phakopsora pachyrhizi]|nr:hypothetical protein BY996DRAFT_6413937 [Phakopsora pachyrhizi]
MSLSLYMKVLHAPKYSVKVNHLERAGPRGSASFLKLLLFPRVCCSEINLISSTTNPCCVPTRTENKTEEDSHPGVDILSFPGSNGGVQLPSPNPQLPLPEVSSGSSTAQGTSDKNYGQTISPDKLPPPPPPTPSPLSIPSPEPDVTTTNISPVGYTTPSAPPSNSPINPTNDSPPVEEEPELPSYRRPETPPQQNEANEGQNK